jgi:hypothetical protein
MATELMTNPSRESRASEWRPGVDGWPFVELLATDFRVERRRNPRWKVEGRASLLFLGSGLGKVLELDELDGSPWWIGGNSDAPAEVGTRVSVGFSDPLSRPAQGVVMRCERKGRHFRIAVRFDEAPVA